MKRFGIVFGTVALLATVIATVWILVGTIAATTIERVATREAAEKADHWADYMGQRLPEIGALIETGRPTPLQYTTIRNIQERRSIFRFVLYDRDGRLRYDSLDGPGGTDLAAQTRVDVQAARVAETSRAFTVVEDGSEKPDRPDYYAESYVPVFGTYGTVIGVAEIYVDVTATLTYFDESFTRFGLALTAICATLFLVPAIGFALKSVAEMRSRRRAQYLTDNDTLTGLLNRRGFLEQAVRLADSGELTAVCYIDVDRFKAINDTKGQAAGDRFLCEIGAILFERVRRGDLVARFGGDEFVVGFRDVDIHQAVRIARDLQLACAEPVGFRGDDLQSTVSIGLAEIGPDGCLDSALGHADEALFTVKSSGRGRTIVYGEEMGAARDRRLVLEDLVRQATETESFELHYQPLIDCTTFETRGYEALLRLKDDSGKPVSPDVFVPVAEALGLIDRIGAWVLHRATSDIASLPGAPTVSVNLSALQFSDGNIQETVAQALHRSGLEAERLELEITESALIADEAGMAFQLDALRDMGVTIAMDDFGTGYSSVSYLWRYGFDRIKIDKSFILEMDDNRTRSLAVLDAVMLLGRRLGMKVTAEGIETSEQKELLADLGCDTLQGYFFGRPEPISAHRDAGRHEA